MLNDAIREIETNGYSTLAQLYSTDQVDKALRLANEWYEKTNDQLDVPKPYLVGDDPYVWNPQNKDFSFLEMILGPTEIQKLLMHFLNDRWFKQIPASEPNYILRSLLLRSSKKPLPMHIDSFVPYAGSHVISMQVAVSLEDQNQENGCTLVVPGSHQAGTYVEQRELDHAVPIESTAGDVVVWDSRLWHAAGENRSGRTRVGSDRNVRAVVGQTDVQHYCDAASGILRAVDRQPRKQCSGFGSIPYDTELDGVDMKRGYDSLRQAVSGLPIVAARPEPSCP